MSVVAWGYTIEVNGFKPNWLVEGQDFQAYTGLSWIHGRNRFTPLIWERVKAIRLPENHFVYTALAKGFEPWGGGDKAPEDWDGGIVLMRDGLEWNNSLQWWSHDGGRIGGKPNESDVIGYRKKSLAITQNLTEQEVREIVGGFDAANRMVSALESRGQLRVVSEAERIAQNIGMPVDDVKRVMDAMADKS